MIFLVRRLAQCTKFLLYKVKAKHASIYNRLSTSEYHRQQAKQYVFFRLQISAMTLNGLEENKNQTKITRCKLRLHKYHFGETLLTVLSDLLCDSTQSQMQNQK